MSDEMQQSLQADAETLTWAAHMAAEEGDSSRLLALARRLVHIAEIARDREIMGFADRAALEKAQR